MLDYPSLFALAAVVKDGSFERAARTLHVTPSAVSQRIRLLEERLGCALVVRGQPSFLQTELPRVSVPLAVNADSLATWFMSAAISFGRDTPAQLQIAVDDEGHTAHWLRSGQVLAAVTATNAPAAGCNSLPLGAMRYVPAASPAFVARYFPEGIDAASLSKAPSLMFNAKDELQQRWVERHLGGSVQMLRHAMPSPQAFVAAALGGLGWAMHPEALVREYLGSGDLVELKPGEPLDVPLYWQHARMASSLIQDLTRAVVVAAKDGLIHAI
jgi:LysR family transcriptional regulator, chromosome initiation inhibitor